VLANARFVAAHLQYQSSVRQRADKMQLGFWWCQHFTNLEVTWPPTAAEIHRCGPKKM